MKFLKAGWDAIGSEFGSRHTQYEMFYAGARFVTCGPQLPRPSTGTAPPAWWRSSCRPTICGANSASADSIDDRGRCGENRDRQSRADRFRRLARSVRRRRHHHHRRRPHRGGRHRVSGGGRERRRRDRRRRHDRDPRPDRFPRPHHLRRLHAAPAHGRLSRKLSARRHHHRDLRLRGACARPPERSRRRQGAGAGGAALLRRPIAPAACGSSPARSSWSRA